MYKETSLKNYLDDLAAKLSTPGGGSAAALNAAMGAALICMVVNFTIGKPKYASHEKELKEILGKSTKLKDEFLNLVDLDVAAFQSKNLRDALDIPFMLSRLCLEAIKLCPVLLKKGNPNLASDVGVAAVFLESAFTSACFNVEINLKNLGDKRLALNMRRELAKNAKLIIRIRKVTEVKVGEIIRG